MHVVPISKPIAASTVVAPLGIDDIQRRIEQLDAVPTVAAILIPLLRHLEQPAEYIDVQRVSHFIAHDNSLAAQCLRMANSPLYGRRNRCENIRGAVVTLGVLRIREIALSCSLLKLMPGGSATGLAVWQHSLAAALVSRRLARTVSYADPDRAYLAGLLHDIGIVVLMHVGVGYAHVLQAAADTGIGLETAERKLCGATHTFVGQILATHWKLNAEVEEVIYRHHEPERARIHGDLVSIIHVADVICRANGLGYPFAENLAPEDQLRAWERLCEQNPRARKLDWSAVETELTRYLGEVRSLVNVVSRLA